MFSHHLRFFIRKVGKDLSSYLLSHFGLVIGFSVAILLGTYIYKEFTTGTYVDNYERIYRINTVDPQVESALNYGYLKPMLVNDFPEVEHATRIMQLLGQSVFRVEDRTFNIAEQTAFFVDKDFLDVFELPVVSGSRNIALNKPNAIVLTESFAYRLFGTKDPVGEIIEEVSDEGSQHLIVTAVLQDLPITSHLQFDFIQSGHTLGSFWDYLGELESGTRNYIYYKAKENTDPRTLDQKFAANFPEIAQQKYELISRPIANIHLDSVAKYEHAKTSNKEQIILIGFGGLLLFIAAFINYVIIHTTQLMDRSKEFGIQKTMGISSSQWIAQMIVESVISALTVGIVAVLCAYYLNAFMLSDSLGVDLFAIITTKHWLVFGLLLLILATTTVASSILKLKVQFTQTSRSSAVISTHTNKGASSKLSLIVQFSFALLVICGSYFVWQQLRHLQSLDMGYTSSWRINITRTADTSHDTWNSFKSKLTAIPGIENKGSSLHEWAGKIYYPDHIKVSSGDMRESVGLMMKSNYISDGLIPTLGLELLSGRNFDSRLAKDTFNILINETAAKKLGINEIVGKGFRSYDFGDKSERVIGVVKDFHIETMDKEIEPMALFFLHDDYWKENLIVQLNSRSIDNSLVDIKKAWEESGIISPFEYTFLDQFQARLFERETQNAQFMGITASCSILVALIGLIGLVSFQNKRRSKELSLRKVFGASISELLLMINKSYLMLVGASILLSTPVAYYGVNQWLDGYAYRITPSVTDFIVVVLGVIIVSVTTVSLQSWRTAHTNPTDVLRGE
ncbi:MAG: ABC transporter permease [Bacteroidota bacterium]